MHKSKLLLQGQRDVRQEQLTKLRFFKIRLFLVYITFHYDLCIPSSTGSNWIDTHTHTLINYYIISCEAKALAL